VTITGDDGVTRYYTGSFTDVDQAARHKVQMLINGFDGAFLVAFRGGQRISLTEAGAVSSATTEPISNIPSEAIDKQKLRFRVQVATFAGNVPIATMDEFLEIG